MPIRRAAWNAAVLCLSLIGCPLEAAPEPAAPTEMKAVAAAAFVDSIGVNTHLSYRGPYTRRWPAVRDALLRSGIRHIRDGLYDTPWQPYYDHLNDLGDRGIGVTLVTNFDQSARLLAAYPSRVHRIDAYEDPNEADYFAHSPDWAERLRAFAPVVWTAAKTLSPALPVIGPSLQTCDHYAALGDLSAFIDYGNSHDYVSGRNPGTTGYGPRSLVQKGFGSLAYIHSCAQAVAGTRPMAATETGYTTNPSTNIGIPPDVAGLYAPRLFLEQWRSGTTRSFDYELVDEGLDDTERHYGLLDADIRPKPGLLALSALIAELADPAPAFAAGSLPLSIESPSDDVHSVLFEKSDRTFTLAIWREAPCYDVPSRTYIAVAPVQTTIRIGQKLGSHVTVKTFDDLGALNSGRTSTGNVISLAVSDHVSLVSFKARETR